jgi:acetyl-CoA carboxylase carboxyltransferase component
LLFVVFVVVLGSGGAAERAGIERAAGRWFTALATATVPKLTVVVRKAHTAGLFAMCGPAFEPDVFVALPTASIGMASERRAIENVASLERTADSATRDAIRAYLRAMRRPPEHVAQAIVRPSELRALLASRLRPLLSRTRPRVHRPLRA